MGSERTEELREQAKALGLDIEGETLDAAEARTELLRMVEAEHAQREEDKQELTSLRARLEAAERERDVALEKLNCNQCNSGHTTLPVYLWDCPECVKLIRDERDAALRELATTKDALTLARGDLERSESYAEQAISWREQETKRADAANALLRSAWSCIPKWSPLWMRVNAHLTAASPSPAQADGAGRETVCPACSGSGVIEQGWVDGQCQRCSGTGLDAQPAQGGGDA